jgi:perosamine synthetase
VSVTSHRKDYLPFGKPNFTQEEIDAVTRVMQSGWIGKGNEVAMFEKELAAFLNVPHVVCVDSCTSALFLSLTASGITEGDEVIVPSLTFCSSANAAIYCGAKPVFCDVDENTLCTTAELILKKITPKTKAVILVHYGGFPIEIEGIKKVLPPHIKIIEDAAHAFGSSFTNGKKVGASGNLTCFSFYANKNISTGEGGAIALFDEKLADKIRNIRQHGISVNSWQRHTNPASKIYPEVEELGYKMNYIDLHACIGRVQLKRFSEMQKTREAVAGKYISALDKAGIKYQSLLSSANHSKHLFVVKLPLEKIKITRDELILKMREQNIGASVHYMPLHLMKYYTKENPHEKLPVCEKMFEKIITLPISASMTLQDADYVLDAFFRLTSI